MLESYTDQSAVRRTLVATGLGTVFGFQAWRLAEYAFAASISLAGSAWILVSYVMLGLCTGATARFAPWWKRGWLLGLLFSIATAVGTHGPGLKSAPYAVAVMVSGLVSGLLVALLADTFFPFERESAQASFALRPPASEPESPPVRKCKMEAIRERLAAAEAFLEDLDVERELRGDSGFGRSAEDRVVWAELLELELQDIDEQVSRICSTAGAGGSPSRERSWAEKHLHWRKSS